MSTVNILEWIVRLLYQLIFMVGLITILNFADSRWPTGAPIVTCVLFISGVVGILSVFLWHYFFKPLREELKRTDRLNP